MNIGGSSCRESTVLVSLFKERVAGLGGQIKGFLSECSLRRGSNGPPGDRILDFLNICEFTERKGHRDWGDRGLRAKF